MMWLMYDATKKDDYRFAVNMLAANILDGRYNIKGGFIRAWNGDNRKGWSIIDCMMNLPILYWAYHNYRRRYQKCSLIWN